MARLSKRGSDPTTPIIIGLLLLTGFALIKYLPLLIVLAALLGIVAVLVAILVATKLYKKQRRLQQLKLVRLVDVDHMTGVEFEHYIGELLQSQGFKVEYTKVTGDLGADVIATKHGEKFSIQAKRYKGSVGRVAISDAVGAMARYHCNRSMVVTTSYFTHDAKLLSHDNNTQLIDRDHLASWIDQFSRDGYDIYRSTNTTPSEMGYQLVEKHKTAI